MTVLNRGGTGWLRPAEVAWRRWVVCGGMVMMLWSGVTRGMAVEVGGPGYSGHWWKSNLQLYDFRARWYGPAGAHFVSPDGFEGYPARPASMHRYVYAEGDPVNRIDPSGHTSISDVLVSSQVRVYLAAQHGGPGVTAAKLGLGLLTMAAAVNDPETFLSALESPYAAMELAANNVAFVAHYGRRSAQFLAGYAMARWRIQPVVEEALTMAAQNIRRLDPHAVVGFRGSLARGYKGAHKGSGPFDAGAFDVDGFIVSDVLAAEVPVGRVGARFVNAGAPAELLGIQADLDASLRSQLAGMKPQRFTFRIFTTREFLRRQTGAVLLEP